MGASNVSMLSTHQYYSASPKAGTPWLRSRIQLLSVTAVFRIGGVGTNNMEIHFSYFLLLFNLENISFNPMFFFKLCSVFYYLNRLGVTKCRSSNYTSVSDRQVELCRSPAPLPSYSHADRLASFSVYSREERNVTPSANLDELAWTQQFPDNP